MRLPLYFSKTKLTQRLIIYILIAIVSFLTIYLIFNYQKTSQLLSSEVMLRKKLDSLSQELTNLKNQDQVKINLEQKKEIENIQKTYDQAVNEYEKLIDFSGDKKIKSDLEKSFAKSLSLLSKKNYASASAILSDIDKKITEENQKLTAEFKIPQNVPVNNSPPSSGFSQQKVHIDSGDFLVNIVSADLNSTKVIVDTASESDCQDNCPAFSLQDYVSRNNAFAGMNGSFFCPATYPSCAGKTNSFDTLLMNKSKRYFNSDNNVYSVVPAVIFSGNSARFLTGSMDWGRDTGIDSMIANYPLYLIGGNVNFTGNGDPKIDSKGTRTFIATKDNMIYLGIVYNASGGETAQVLRAMAIQNALGMDQGGSTALWFEGYKAGPGRAIPNAILLVKK